MSRTKVFFDTEFTGLHRNTTLISIGLTTEKDARTFYAELSDYDKNQITPWLREHVLCSLTLGSYWGGRREKGEATEVNGSVAIVARELKRWLRLLSDVPESIEMWSDCPAYDWMLFCELFGGADSLPKNVYYIPFDLCTLLLLKGIDPDIDREKLAGTEKNRKKHHALWDAQAIKACYRRLTAQDP